VEPAEVQIDQIFAETHPNVTILNSIRPGVSTGLIRE
jgi:hypothetical protein